MDNQIAKLDGHYIICGYGRIGRLLTQYLIQKYINVVVIEKDQELETRLDGDGVLYLIGQAADENMLIRAGIKRASGIIACVGTDEGNVMLVRLTRRLNPDAFVVARSSRDSSKVLLEQAGADKVILPYLIGGRRIALSLLKPEIMDFIDLIATETNIEIRLEQVTLSRKSELVGLELGKTFIRADLDVIIVMIVRADETVIYNPKSNTKLITGDRLLAIGHPDSLVVLEEIAAN